LAAIFTGLRCCAATGCGREIGFAAFFARSQGVNAATSTMATAPVAAAMGRRRKQPATALPNWARRVDATVIKLRTGGKEGMGYCRPIGGPLERSENPWLLQGNPRDRCASSAAQGWL
jgi:hypothetical protein